MVLEALDPAALGRLAARGRRQDFAAGAAICRRGEPGISLLIVETGMAEVSITTSPGRKSILGVVRPGSIVGDIACLDGGPRSADVTALGPLRALVVDRRDVLDLLSSDGSAALLVIAALCKKARNASEMFELKALGSAGMRLAACILRLMDDETDASEGGRLRVNQAWLGDFSGVSRENVNRQIGAWTKQGVARFENGELVIPDRRRLEEIAARDDMPGLAQ